MKKRELCFRILLIQVLLLTSFITMLNTGAAQDDGSSETRGQAYLTLMADEETQVADVRPGVNNNVTFVGNVCSNLPARVNIHYLIVQINATTDSKWPLKIRPQKVECTPGANEVPFSVSVTVPTETPANVQNTIYIWGNGTTWPGNENFNLTRITGTIRIAQYYSSKIGTDELTREIQKGGHTNCRIDIANTGNGNDTFKIEIDNIDSLRKKGFEFVVPGPVDIEMNETDLFKLMVRAGSETQSGKYKIELSIKSTNDLSLCQVSKQTMILEIVVKEDNAGYYAIGIVIIIMISIIAAILKKVDRERLEKR